MKKKSRFAYYIFSGICSKVQACESSVKQFRKQKQVFIMFMS